jgi:homoserine kinase
MIEPQRAPLIPHFYEVKDAALQAGALGCSISGSGPAMFALTASEQIAQAAVQSMRYIFERNGIQTLGFVSGINKQGATVSVR